MVITSLIEELTIFITFRIKYLILTKQKEQLLIHRLSMMKK